jgi:hypothetical protein
VSTPMTPRSYGVEASTKSSTPSDFQPTKDSSKRAS